MANAFRVLTVYRISDAAMLSAAVLLRHSVGTDSLSLLFGGARGGSLSGLTGGSIMFVLLSRLLWPMMSKPMSRADYQLPGTSARVVSPIRAGGVGEIVYSKGGSRFTAGARSVDEEPVARGEEVVILRYERGIAYVQRVESILNERNEMGGEVKLA